MSSANETNDPFSDANYRVIQFVQLGRIYDVLMALLQIEDAEAANRLLEAHAAGSIVTPSPQYTGDFIFDRLNAMENPPESE